MNFYADCENLLGNLKQQAFIPMKSGNLKHHAILGNLETQDTYVITFSEQAAPYIPFLEEGTAPHDIPFAFVGKGNWKWWYPYGDGIPFLFGTGGRFNGKFHPGSTKHEGFIKNKTVKYIIEYFIKQYGGEVR